MVLCPAGRHQKWQVKGRYDATGQTFLMLNPVFCQKLNADGLFNVT